MAKTSMRARGENAAAAYLERVGICVVERRWRCEAGIVDIVGFDSDVLVLVDVKTKRAGQQVAGKPVSAAVARRARKLAMAYMQQADLQERQWRFDRIEILVIADDRALLRHHRDAIDTCV